MVSNIQRREVELNIISPRVNNFGTKKNGTWNICLTLRPKWVNASTVNFSDNTTVFSLTKIIFSYNTQEQLFLRCYCVCCNAKSSAIAILVFFILFFLVAFSGRTGKILLRNFHQLFFRHSWPRSGVLHWTHRLVIIYVLKFREWEHDMPCALEIISNGELKRGHVESCPSTTKNILSTLPQDLSPPK